MTNLEGEEPVGRLDRADLRADRSDSRMDRSDIRAKDYEHKSKDDLDVVGSLLRNVSTALEELDSRIADTKRDLAEERVHDRKSLRKLRTITLVSLIAASLASVSTFAVCKVANENRDTFRIIVAAAVAGSPPSATPEAEARKQAFQKVVDDRTEPINCVNPLNYLVG